MPIHDWTRVDAGIFHDFHHEWISTVKGALNAGRIPSAYYALAEQIGSRPYPEMSTTVTDSERYAQQRSRIAIRHVSDDRVSRSAN
jgi:hypothetical protein